MAELVVPESLYGVAIAEPLVLNRKVDGNLIYFTEIIRVQIVLMVNYGIQVLFLFEVAEVDWANSANICSDSFLWMQVMCVLVFEVTVFSEIRESMNVCLLIAKAPINSDSNGFRSMRGQPKESGAILGNEPEEEKKSKLGRMMKRARRSPPEGTAQWSLDDITLLYKFWCMISVGIPKLTLAVLLGYTGGVYIAQSLDQETMLLNTLAVLFVIDIDEILYEAFTSDHSKDSLENMKSVEVDVSNRVRLMSWIANAMLFPIIVAAATGATIFATKGAECEGYKWPWAGWM